MTRLQRAFTEHFNAEELDKVETETLEAEQRQAANDARDPHVVVTVSMTTTTTQRSDVTVLLHIDIIVNIL